MDVLSRRIDIFVDPDERRRHDVDTSKPRARRVRQRRCGGFKQGLPQFLEVWAKVDNCQYDWRAWRRLRRARKDVADHYWRAQPAAEHRPPVALLSAHGALGQFDEIQVTQIEQ